MKFNYLSLVALAGIGFVGMLTANPGISENKIILGQTAATGGPASALGSGMKEGLNLWFDYVNQKGGINGRQIELITYDDGYEPGQALENAKKLVETDSVFALIGGVGTPTAKAVVPYIQDQGVPFIGPFTGAGFLRDASNNWVVNVRASYDQEMEALVAHLHDEKGLKNIGIFYQNDGYGQAGLSGLKKAMEKRGLNIAGEATYERNTLAVKQGVLAFRRNQPEAIVMVGAYKPCAEFIRVARKARINNTLFCNISFVGTHALFEELGDQADNVLISQVMPDPRNDGSALVQEYLKLLKATNPDAKPDWISLEGFAVAKLFTSALEKTGGTPTREALMQAIADTGKFDLGGAVLEYGEGDSQGMNAVYLTAFQDTQIIDL
ncbi:MAG: ABC transporter substrate-binding protein [Opitutales bacterium]